MPTASGKRATRGNFRQRYDDLEHRRVVLVERLSALSEAARTHPAHGRAMRLLNETFRKEKLAQRLGVLQAATWLIEVLEKLMMIS
jgi:hypothetical protein